MKLIQPRGMKQLYALEEKRSIDLSLSENPLGCSPLVLDALHSLQSTLSDYPFPNGGSLKTTLASSLNASISSLFVSNGSGTIISALNLCFAGPGASVVIPQLTFPMFRICAEISGAVVVTAPMTSTLGIDLVAIQKAVRPDTRLVFICNPNNPTGSTLSKRSILSLCDSLPIKCLLVVDEANVEFGGTSVANEVINRKNLVVLRTFSKGFGLAALRIGFAIADVAIIQTLEENTDIFPISKLSETLASIALQDMQFIARTRRCISRERRRLKKQLLELGFSIFPSKANNMFVKIPDSISSNRFKTLLNDENISVVIGSKFPGYTDRFFRLSIRTPRVNAIFLQAMKKLVREG